MAGRHTEGMRLRIVVLIFAHEHQRKRVARIKIRALLDAFGGAQIHFECLDSRIRGRIVNTIQKPAERSIRQAPDRHARIRSLEVWPPAPIRAGEIVAHQIEIGAAFDRLVKGAGGIAAERKVAAQQSDIFREVLAQTHAQHSRMFASEE